MGRVASGIVADYFWNAVILTIPVSFILLMWYRRVLNRAMRAPSGGEAAGVAGAAGTGAGRPLETAGLDEAERAGRFRLAVVYTAAAALGAAVWAAIVFMQPDMEFRPLRGFLVWYAYCWPVVPVLATLLAMERRRVLYLFAGYVLAGVLVALAWSGVYRVVLGQSNVSPPVNAASFLGLLAGVAWMPLLLILVAGSRYIRGVTPLALAGLLVFSFSLLGVGQSFSLLLGVRWLRAYLLAFGSSSQIVWSMLASLVVGYVCWRGLGAVNALFQGKSFSDLQLLADLYWLVVAFDLSAQFATSFGWGGLLALAGFAVFRASAGLGLAMWRPRGQPGARLLLLRVFGFQRRTGKLFDSIAQRWRFRGSVQMIAGTDLAARTIDPDDMMAFLGGNLHSRFVRSAGDLAARLAGVDQTRDPDGRFRVTEFYCHEDTWRPALTALLGRCDAVLMDLRSFSETNSGCIFELQQLAEQGRLDRTLLVVDSTTDIALLESTVRREEAGSGPAELHLERVERGSAAEHARAYRSLQRLAASPA